MYRPLRIGRTLRPAVRAAAVYDERRPGPALVRREVPATSVTVIVPVAGTLEVASPAGGPPRGAFVAGLASGPSFTAFAGRQAGLQLDLHPLALARLGLGAAELTDRAVDLTDLGPRSLRTLHDRVAGAATWEDAIRAAGDVLRRLLADGRPVEPEVARAWCRLAGSAADGAAVPEQRVGQVAAEVGWSRRHLLARFRDRTGVTPTTARRLARFGRATGLLAPGRGPDRRGTEERIADVAAAAGFADHAHLVREFRALAHCTPGRWLAEVSGSVPVFPAIQDTAPTTSRG